MRRRTQNIVAQKHKENLESGTEGKTKRAYTFKTHIRDPNCIAMIRGSRALILSVRYSSTEKRSGIQSGTRRNYRLTRSQCVADLVIMTQVVGYRNEKITDWWPDTMGQGASARIHGIGLVQMVE